MKKGLLMKKILLILLLILLNPIHCFASSDTSETMQEAEEEAQSQISGFVNSYDDDEINGTINESIESEEQLDFTEIVAMAINGELDFSFTDLVEKFLERIFSEIYELGYLMKNIIIVGILSALLKTLADSFKSKQIAELGFFACYILLVAIIFSSFNIAVGLLQSLVFEITTFMTALIPLILTLLFASLQPASATLFAPTLYFSVDMINMLIGKIVVPLIIGVSSISIINCLSQKDYLNNLCDLLTKIIKWIIKGSIFAFLGILSLEKISIPIINNLAVNTTRTLITAVPVVGDLMSNSIDMILHVSSALKSGVAVAVVVVLLSITIVPIIEIFVFYIVFKITGAIIQPICDARIVKCLDVVAKYSSILLSTATLITVMFIVSNMVLLLL